MPRHPRLFIPGACYHVYCRVARGEFVFDDPLEADEFIDSIDGSRGPHATMRECEGWHLSSFHLP